MFKLFLLLVLICFYTAFAAEVDFNTKIVEQHVEKRYFGDYLLVHNGWVFIYADHSIQIYRIKNFGNSLEYFQNLEGYGFGSYGIYSINDDYIAISNAHQKFIVGYFDGQEWATKEQQAWMEQLPFSEAESAVMCPTDSYGSPTVNKYNHLFIGSTERWSAGGGYQIWKTNKNIDLLNLLQYAVQNGADKPYRTNFDAMGYGQKGIWGNPTSGDRANQQLLIISGGGHYMEHTVRFLEYKNGEYTQYHSEQATKEYLGGPSYGGRCQGWSHWMASAGDYAIFGCKGHSWYPVFKISGTTPEYIYTLKVGVISNISMKKDLLILGSRLFKNHFDGTFSEYDRADNNDVNGPSLGGRASSDGNLVVYGSRNWYPKQYETLADAGIYEAGIAIYKLIGEYDSVFISSDTVKLPKKISSKLGSKAKVRAQKPLNQNQTKKLNVKVNKFMKLPNIANAITWTNAKKNQFRRMVARVANRKGKTNFNYENILVQFTERLKRNGSGRRLLQDTYDETVYYSIELESGDETELLNFIEDSESFDNADIADEINNDADLGITVDEAELENGENAETEVLIFYDDSGDSGLAESYGLTSDDATYDPDNIDDIVDEAEWPEDAYTQDFTFTVPVGVHEVDVSVHTGELTFSFQVSTSAYDELEFDFNDICYNGNDGIDFSLNGEQKASVPGLGDCAGDLTYGDDLLNAFADVSTGNLWVKLAYTSTCPVYYTNLKSDFNPILLADSSLYVVDNEPLVRVNFGLPAYYYDISASYGDDCDAEPSLSSSVNVDDGCQLDYKSEINYVDHCSFALDSDATKPSDRRLLEQGYSYSGKLQISAKLDLQVAGFQVTRTVTSPLNWRVWVQKTIEVSSQVEISNNNKCVDETDCNSNGCCVDGVCDCTCAEFGNGFNGDYCEEDITPPTCDLGDASITVQSEHGGCVIVSDDINANLPGFDDNSGIWYVIRNSTDAPTLTSSFPEDNNDIASNCWGIGTHKVQWHVQDVPLSDPHTENDHAFCSLTIIVEDNEDPFVDCQQCQNAEDVSASEIAICTSVLGANSFVRSVVNYDDLDQHFNDENLDANDVAYPGSVAYGGYLDCDCEYEEGGSLPAVNHITKTWDSWGNIRSWDIVDGNHQINYPDAQEDDGQYPLTYSASDDSGNSGSCGIGVTFDITAPTCDGFELTIGTDPLSKNYSLPVDFDINVSYDASISGLDQGPVLTPHRETGAQYWVGYEYNATYESIWWITDLAGNNGTCAWKVIVDNPNPCVYPTCDDAPPYVVGDCPSDVTRQCADNDGCGCGAWTNPVFADDKFVKYIDVIINGMTVDTYNNDGTTNAYDNELQFGVNHIKYIAYDMHGENAQCYWRVTMEDHVAPVLDDGVTCPQGETLDTITTNADYSYSFSHNDECILNQDVTYNGGLVGGDNVTIPSGSHTLDVGTYSFRYTIRDDNNNPTYCNWDIEVADVQDPSIDCPEDISERIEQGSSYINIDWTTQASDNWQLASLTHSPNQPGDPFVAGSYTVTSTATDAAGNTSTCSFNIVITEAYPTVYFKPALAGAIVSDISAANSAPEFGATLTLATLTNVYHEVLPQPNGITALAESADNDNDQIDGTIDMISNCASDAAICEKNYEFDVIFDGCDANDKAYDLNAEVDCTPTDCYEANANIEFTVSLTASNYCWQDLASVQVDAEMVTIDGADYQNIIDTYNSATFTLPSHVSVFYNQNAVAGIIHVTSDQVLTKKINIDSVKSEWFASNTYHVDDKVDEHVDSELGSDFKTDELSGIAGWYYTENKLELETNYFTRYTAQITIDYEFGGSSRRMLLDIDAQRQLAQSDDEAIVKDAVAETMTSGTVSTTAVSVDDAVVVVMVNNCQESNTNDQAAINNAVAQYLHIDANRVNTLIEATTEGYCLAEVTLEQSNCAGNVDIITLMSYLQDAVTDSFSTLHTTLTASDISLDSNVYFVAQTPSTTSYQAASVSSSSNTSSDATSVWYYAVAGAIIGLVACQIAYKFAGSKDANNVKHKPVSSERRYSIADLLAATERRSSIDVGNVKLHSAF